MKFLSIFPVVLLLSFSWLGNVEASHKIFLDYQSVSAVKVLKQEHRTGYHFQPKKHWLNDPNGPMYYNGLYHLFYQHNPKGAVWGNIVWAHSVSKDLINWEALEHALVPSRTFDKYGCWSGSVTILPGNKPIILYTGVTDEKMKIEVQNYAIPADLSDPYLRKWIKPNDNPFLIGDDGINKTAFRDPTTAWMGKDGHWRMIIGSRRKRRGIAYLYRSKDFKKWTKAKHPLHSTLNAGVWECPDFFPVSLEEPTRGMDVSARGKNVKHVLKVSLDSTRYDYYTIGTYYTQKDKYIPDKNMVDGWRGLRFDYGNFYASKSFFEPSKNRRIVWGWVNESDTTTDDVRKGWAGIMSIPRTISLDPSGKQLLFWPVKELETLRGKSASLSSKKLKKGEQIELKGITAAQADVEVTFSFPSLDKAEAFDPRWANMDAQELCSEKGSTVQGGLGPFGLLTLASKHLEEYTPVFFRVFKAKYNRHVVLMCSDASSSSLKNGLYKPSFAGFLDVDLNKKKLSLRSLIDRSVVESFGEGGKVCITSRVYPTFAFFDKAHLYAFNNGTETITIESLEAWSMHGPLKMN